MEDSQKIERIICILLEGLPDRDAIDLIAQTLLNPASSTILLTALQEARAALP